MRSFKLIFAILSLLLSQQVQSIDKDADIMPLGFFTVTLPYEVGDLKNGVSQEEKIAPFRQEAMQTLLMRLTGRKQLLSSQVGQDYINNAKAWLAGYKIKPRMEDGVAVGQYVEFRFDAPRIKASFVSKHIKLWPKAFRPFTLVMGSFVQQGRLEKLDQEILNYRIDVDYRDYPQALGLPVYIPENDKQWVFPVEPANNFSLIQELLLTHNQQNLLSFKLRAMQSGQYELSWYLFTASGSVLDNDIQTGGDRQTLLKNMFENTMNQYVKQSAVKAVRKNRLYLTVNQVAFGDHVNLLEETISAQQPMISRIQLTELQAGKAIFAVDYQGDYQTVVNWLKNWRMTVFVGEQSANKNVQVNINHQYLTNMEIEEDKETYTPGQASPNATMTGVR